jgi:hypothetical protein
VSGLELVDGFGREVPGGSSDLCRGPNTAIVFTHVDEVKQEEHGSTQQDPEHRPVIPAIQTNLSG